MDDSVVSCTHTNAVSVTVHFADCFRQVRAETDNESAQADGETPALPVASEPDAASTASAADEQFVEDGPLTNSIEAAIQMSLQDSEPEPENVQRSTPATTTGAAAGSNSTEASASSAATAGATQSASTSTDTTSAAASLAATLAAAASRAPEFANLPQTYPLQRTQSTPVPGRTPSIISTATAGTNRHRYLRGSNNLGAAYPMRRTRSAGHSSRGSRRGAHRSRSRASRSRSRETTQGSRSAGASSGSSSSSTAQGGASSPGSSSNPQP